MKLYLNQASPYARLIKVLLIETNLIHETEMIFVDPWASSDDLLNVNPASKVPALVLQDGTQLIESSCICDYLIQRSGQSSLSPTSHNGLATRCQVLGLGRAAIDCSFSSVIQQRYAPKSPLKERWLTALPRIARTLDEVYSRGSSHHVDLADLTIAVAFEYIDFRLPDIQWKEQAPHLAQRVNSLKKRNSLASTSH
ncbi:glutathione S-transferase N-terminal domain-containing protein [Kiloniella sp.]|uniref:glutathione S-transferase N-terminal domain-containing protein n=1 Tax=Kiloniella sp. TaxID=1938587 RepID=UPI003B02E301